MKPAAGPGRRCRSWVWECVLIFAVALTAYAPAFHGGLVWNDSDYITRPELQPLGGLRRIWFEVGATEQYYPVLHTAFWIEHRLWGDAPWGYHALNILLHATSASLLVLVLRRLSIPGAVLAGLLFAVHPICVESVAWISEEKNTLSTVFYLFAALAYLRFEGLRERSAARSAAYLTATALFVLATLSKSVTASLPGALLVAIWWWRGRLSWKDVRPLVPWFFIGATVGLFTGWVERTYIIGAGSSEFKLDFASRCLLAGRAVWFYFGKLLWPDPLIFFYPRWKIDPGAPWQYVPLVAASVVLAGAWFFRLRHRGPLAAILFFVGALFPILGFLNVYAFRFSFVADHFQYLACMGVFAAVASGLSLWAETLPVVRTLGATALLCLLGALTWRQCHDYRDLETFYRATLDRNPDSWIAHNNLGNFLLAQNRASEAIIHYRAALGVRNDLPETENNLGTALDRMGQPEEALLHFGEALRLRIDYPEAEYNIANLMREAGRVRDAAAHYQAALRNRANFPEAEFNFGQLLQQSGNPREAIPHYEAALRFKPAYPEAENNEALALAVLGRPQEAIGHYREALRLKPDFAAADYNLGLALRATGKTGEAIDRLSEAERLQPDYADAWDASGICMAEMGRAQEAMDCYGRSLKLRPNDAGVLGNLGGLLLSLGRAEEAISMFEKSLRLQPGVPERYFSLGVALSKAGRKEEALVRFKRALELRPDFADARRALEALPSPR